RWPGGCGGGASAPAAPGRHGAARSMGNSYMNQTQTGIALTQDVQRLSALLALTLGFVLVVVGLHAGELLLLAVRPRQHRRRRWVLAASGAIGCAGVLVIVTVTVLRLLQEGTVQVGDVMALLGIQSALVVCVPPRLIAPRLRRAELVER